MISPDGEITLLPAYRQQSVPQITTQGSYSVELISGEGTPVQSYRFDPYEIGDAPGYLGFGFAVPAMEGLSAIRVIGPSGEILAEAEAGHSLKSLSQDRETLAVETRQGATVLRWGAAGPQVVYRLRLSLDGGQTWQVLALDWTGTEFAIPEDRADFDQAHFEVQASDGVQTETRRRLSGEANKRIVKAGIWLTTFCLLLSACQPGQPGTQPRH
jgi:hypothetical protein